MVVVLHTAMVAVIPRTVMVNATEVVEAEMAL